MSRAVLAAVVVAAVHLALCVAPATAFKFGSLGPWHRDTARCAEGHAAPCDVTEEHHAGVQPRSPARRGEDAPSYLDLLPFYHPLGHNSLVSLLMEKLHHEMPPAVLRMAVDVREKEETYELTVDVPGLRREEIDVAVHDGNVLTISGERTLETTENKTAQQSDSDAAASKSTEVAPSTGYSRVERLFGRFVRSFTMPRNADLDHIKAVVSKGVLTVSVPKRAVSADPQGKVNIEWSEL